MINEMVDHLGEAFTALSDPTRRQVIELLLVQPRGSSSLAELAGTSRAAMSRHLGVLRASGLVQVSTPEGDARQRLYALREEQFVAVQAWLDQVRAFWGEQLSSFADHANQQKDED